ncbi:MAG TPA: CoA transferase [Acidimicrobiales bacterium]|nr:CoA transferase [Acidimicrobiales bacterium]
MRQLLSGINVVELAEGVAGSYCGKLFADLGADVVKVEPPSGDELRHRESAVRGPDALFRGGAFLHLNTNKRSMVIDASTVAGRETLARLLVRSHLLIETTGRGRHDNWGLTWNSLHAWSPRLSLVRLSGFGATGPYADYLWDDLIAQAVSNSLLLGDTDEGPVRLPGHLGLCFVGNMAALGGLAAVLEAEATGEGSFVDCSATEALATFPPRQATMLAHQYRHGAPGPTLFAARESLIPGGVHPCADGYMAMMSTPQQLDEMLEVLDDDNLRAAFSRPDAFERGDTKEAIDAALYPWLLARTRAEATAAAQLVGWPLAGVNSPFEVLAADHLRQRGFWVHADDPGAGSIDLPGPPCRFAEGGWSIRRLAPSLGEQTAEVGAELEAAGSELSSELVGVSSVGSPRPPLSGIRIVDMTTVWSGPYATMLLADLGAEVIRVENPWVLPPTTKGYQARPTLSNPGFLASLYGPGLADRPDRPWNRHAMNNSLARNKLSCTIDTRRTEGHELLMRLVERSDVFIENFKASGLADIGIQTSELQARNPRLIIVRMPPTGTTGDWCGYTGFGAQFDGLSSMLWLCGHRGSDLTTTPGTTYMDAASGPGAAFATIAALRYRTSTDRGQLIEFAQIENIVNHLGDILVDCQLGVAPQRWGNRDPWRAPQGLYPCRGENDWLAISVGDDEAWRAFAAVLGRGDLAGDPRFADLAGRQRHHDELDAIIAAWTADRSSIEGFHALQGAGVAAGPLLDEASFANDPHFRDRQWQRPLPSSDVGTHLHPGLPYRGVPQAWRRGSPVLGEDNEYVYQQLLGVSDEDFERYRREKILAEDYLDPSGEPY